jgi:hypothetical protein
VDNVPEIDGHIWCPCVGDGSLTSRLLHHKPTLTFFTNDIDVNRRADHHGDATKLDTWLSMLMQDENAPDWIIENPPFNCELPIVKLAYNTATIGVIVMARISFTEPTKDKRDKKTGKITSHGRGPWLSEHPYQKRITLERYSFTGNGKSDSTTTDWLIWSKVPLSGPFGISAHGYK